MHQLETDQASVASDELSSALTIAELTVEHPCLACKAVHPPYPCPVFNNLGHDEEMQKAIFFALAKQAQARPGITRIFPRVVETNDAYLTRPSIELRYHTSR